MTHFQTPPSRGLFVGIVLILVGLLFAATTGVGGQILAVAIGVGLLAAYVPHRRYGYLVAGSILTGLGAGIILDPNLGGHGAALITGLGFGFLGIFAIDSLRGLDKAHGWPLIPGTILLLARMEMVTRDETWLTWLASWWPLVVIAAGVLFIVRTAVHSRPAP